MENVQCIYSDAFMNCRMIEELDIPNIKEIYSYAFSGCSNLKELNITNITVISDDAFKDCENPEHIYVGIEGSCYTVLACLKQCRYQENR